jgi:putative ABC transport system substrate-binding protein
LPEIGKRKLAGRLVLGAAMRRRDFLAWSGSVVLASPAPVFAQQGSKVARLGFLFAGTLAERPQAKGFWDGLRDLGYTTGKNLVIQIREAKGQNDRLPQLARELVDWKPDVLVAVTPVAITAAQQATSSIPIVMAITTDPVAHGHVKNLARPEANTTGPTQVFDQGLVGKRLQLLKELVPDTSRVGVIWNTLAPHNELVLKILKEAASSLRIELQPLPFQGPDKLPEAFAAAVRQRPRALYVASDAVTFDKRATVIAFAAENRFPTVYFFVDEAEEGGLVAYGVSLRNEYRRSAPYVDKILRGAKPGDLPVEQNAQHYLVVNRRAAKALGIAIPQSILLRANQVIE